MYHHTRNCHYHQRPEPILPFPSPEEHTDASLSIYFWHDHYYGVAFGPKGAITIPAQTNAREVERLALERFLPRF